MKRIIVCGGGFAGLNAVKELARSKELEIILIDRKNYHTFQPLLYQVATAGLDSEDIAPPIRHLVYRYSNVKVLKEIVCTVSLEDSLLTTDCSEFKFDYLLLACGSQQIYFGHNEWEEYAPGLKTIEQSLEIRTRILETFEEAERESEEKRQGKFLKFVIVGGGPTGVELAGAIAEMTRFTLKKDFRNIDPARTKILLVEASPRILPMFSEKLSNYAARDLDSMGVEVMTDSRVTKVDRENLQINGKTIEAGVVIWAAGVEAVSLNWISPVAQDKKNRIQVESDLSIKEYPNVFVAGDQACLIDQKGKTLPGLAAVAMQQGKFVGKTILNDLQCKSRRPFIYKDKGIMATIGRKKAVVEMKWLNMRGFFAWLIWLGVHVWYLSELANRILIIMQWGWAYLRYRRGARLLLDRNWRFYPSSSS